MTSLTKLHGVVHARIIELRDELNVPDGTEIIVDIAVPKIVEELRTRPPELEAACGGLASFGDEIDAFNRWYRAARQGDFIRELEYWQQPSM